MTDKAARMLMVGMLAIAAAIVLSQGLYVAIGHPQIPAVVVNKYTGKVWLGGTSYERGVSAVGAHSLVDKE